MPETKSEPTLMVEALADAMYERYTQLKEAWAVPFGTEQITMAEYRKRYESMTREQRVQEMIRYGPELLLRILSGGEQ